MILSIAVEDDGWQAVPDLENLAERAAAAISAADGSAGDGEVAVLFTGDDEVAALNQAWRGKPSSTNVLSFPAPRDQPRPPGEPVFLGDIALASGVVAREAAEQGKDIRAHTAHLVVHGLLHIMGYDHEGEEEAAAMEGLETRVLARLGFPDPYAADKLL